MYVLRSSISVSTKLFTHRKSVFLPIGKEEKTGIFRDKKMIFFFCLLSGLRGGGQSWAYLLKS